MDSIAAGEKLDVGRKVEDESRGLKVYTSILGGLPGIPLFLGSKSTSGMYQGRALRTGGGIEARATHLDLERASPSIGSRSEF